MLSDVRQLKQSANEAFSQGKRFALKLQLPPAFNVRETRIYLQERAGSVRAYVPADFRCMDELLDSQLLSAPGEIVLGNKQFYGREFLMPPLPLTQALEWLEQALGLENGMPALPRTAQTPQSKANVMKTDSQAGNNAKRKRSSDIQFLTDLTELAAQGKLTPVIGRVEEIELVILILQKMMKGNPILVGEAGVGKTAIVEGLAQRIVVGAIPDSFPVRRILELHLSDLIAGASTMGEPEKRTKQVIDAVKGNKEIVLWIDEIHSLKDARGTLPLADFLKPLIAKGELRIIGATTSLEYRKIEADAALARRFVKITVEEPSIDETKAILLGVKQSFESDHRVSVDPSLIDDIVPLAYRHLPHRHFPDKAIDLLDLGCAVCKNRGLQQVQREHILEAAEKISGIPVHELSKDEATKLLELESYMKRRIIGQDHAINILSNALRAKRAGLSWADTPIGLIFVGPTGVGKTETARVLAEFMLGSSDSLIRLDMSEYREAHTVSKLIGAPPGYVGYDQGGMLTEAVRSMPFSVLLFDEIEKAHPDVSNVLLQILDYGNLTDSSGMAANFKETIVILTSNIPYSALKGYFRPELLGRLKVVSFRALAAEDMREIARIELEALKSRLIERQVELVYTDEALTHISGLDSEYGARELKRHIDERIIQPLSYLLLREQTQKVAVEVEAGEITLRNQKEVTL